MSETLSTMIAKPFNVGISKVTSEQIVRAIDRLANIPMRFPASDLVPAVLPGESYVVKQEALNRLLQRWRKLGLVSFSRGKWQLSNGAWETMQLAARQAGRGDGGHG